MRAARTNVNRVCISPDQVGMVAGILIQARKHHNRSTLQVGLALIGIFFPVGAGVVVDEVNRTNADASRIETVSAKTGYSPRHFPFLLTS
jgi:hypothetical protein